MPWMPSDASTGCREQALVSALCSVSARGKENTHTPDFTWCTMSERWEQPIWVDKIVLAINMKSRLPHFSIIEVIWNSIMAPF